MVQAWTWANRLAVIGLVCGALGTPVAAAAEPMPTSTAAAGTGGTNEIAGKSTPTVTVKVSPVRALPTVPMKATATVGNSSNRPTGVLSLDFYHGSRTCDGGVDRTETLPLLATGTAPVSTGNINPGQPGWHSVKPRYSGDVANNASVGACQAFLVGYPISGIVYQDTIAPYGEYSAGEPVHRNATVTLTGPQGAVVDRFTTDASGAYTVWAPAPGTYSVSAAKGELGPGVQKQQTVLVAGAEVTGRNLVLDLASVRGGVFLDRGNDGYQGDPTADPPMPGVAVTLTGTETDGDQVRFNLTTDAAGGFLFRNLRAGSYLLTTQTPPGHTAVRGAGADTAQVAFILTAGDGKVVWFGNRTGSTASPSADTTAESSAEPLPSEAGAGPGSTLSAQPVLATKPLGLTGSWEIYLCGGLTMLLGTGLLALLVLRRRPEQDIG